MKFNSNTGLRRIVSLVLVVMLTLSLAACGKDPAATPSSGSVIENSGSLIQDENSNASVSGSDISSSDSSGSGSESSGSASSAPFKKDTRTPKEIQKAILTSMVNAHQSNRDVVGWLYLPGTDINEPVVQYDNNDYYLRRGWKGNQDFNGCYFGDYRSTITNRKELSKNTVIYGHSMSDDPNGVKFGQLNKYLDATFATAPENQFIYFSTPESEMVWQVFAVFDTTTSLKYNNPELDDASRTAIINKARAASKIKYEVEVGASDKILTLSTCTYRHDANYPNKYRFVVMAKLLGEGATPTAAKAEVNTANAMAVAK